MNAIEVMNLTKKYKNVTAVDNISFSVKEGEFFAFLGENGAGKSTTINTICTILKKTSGTVRVFGHELDKEDKEIRSLIGIVFQNSVLDAKLTVKENLLTRASYYGLGKKEAMERLTPFMEIFELSEIWNQKYETLSGGQRRRVDIVRALINQPKILFLDEPTTGLDPKSRKLVWSYIYRLKKECNLTVFLTTHYMEEVVDADRVVIMDHGHIIENDTPANLKTKYTHTRLYWYAAATDENKLLVQNYEYTYEADHFIVLMNHKEIREFLYRNEIENYEVFKGTMDDVFLTLTGREMK